MNSLPKSFQTAFELLTRSILLTTVLFASLPMRAEDTPPGPGGIGAYMEVDGVQVKLTDFTEGSGAVQAGLVKEGIITSVGETSVKGLNAEEVAALTIGTAGSVVIVNYLAPGAKEFRLVEITRSPIVITAERLLNFGFVEFLKHQASLGDPSAMHVLGEAMLKGRGDLPENLEEGMKLIRSASDMGEFSSIKFLAYHHDGKGEIDKALPYFAKLLPIVKEQKPIEDRIRNLKRVASLLRLPTNGRDTEKKIGDALNDNAFYKWLQANKYHLESLGMKASAAALD